MGFKSTMSHPTHAVARRRAGFLVLTLLLSAFLGGQRDASAQPPPRNERVETQDGVSLRTEVFLPKAKGAFPTVLMRTPYSKWLENDTNRTAQDLASAGFACVVQDCRGTGKSAGQWYPYRYETTDGMDTLTWVRKQLWCNGSVGLYGDSYLGYTHFCLANKAGEMVKAGYAHVPTFDWYDTTYLGGAMRLDARVTWNTFVARPNVDQAPLVVGNLKDWNWETSYRHLPLLEWDKTVGHEIAWMRDSVKHPQRDEYWRDFEIAGDLNETVIPNLVVSGWYDIFLDQALRYPEIIRKHSLNKRAREHQHVVIGPWGHAPNKRTGQRDFGENSTKKLDELRRDWYAHWLNGANNGIDKLPMFQLFVMGGNRWRESNDWPLPQTQWTKYYFHSKGAANSLQGDGKLTTAPPQAEEADRFVYDPDNPVPTNGGEFRLFAPWGPQDQRPIEARDDVLVYTSEVVKEPLEVTGPIRVVLYAATSARDTDWTAKLVDVAPDGKAFNLCDGIIRARYRNPEKGSELLEPEKVYRYEIDLWATSNEFQPGHRVRIEVSSSNFPRFNRNLNTGATFGQSSEFIVAYQTVLHNSEYASHVVLPVIPK